MRKFFFACVLFAASCLCRGDYQRPPPYRGFRPVPPTRFRPSVGPLRDGGGRPCCGPPRGGYRPSYRPPVGSYRPYWPKDPNKGSNDYQSLGFSDDNQFQSLGLGNPATGEATVSSYFPVSSNPSSGYDPSPSYAPSPHNSHSYHGHRRPPYQPAFKPSEEIFTGLDIFSRPPTNMVPPVFSGQAPDYSSPTYSNPVPVDPTPIFGNQPAEFSPSNAFNQPPNPPPIFSNQPSDPPPIFSDQPFDHSPSNSLDNLPEPTPLFPNQPTDYSPSDSFNPPPDPTQIFSDLPPPKSLANFDPKPYSTVDFWLPSGSIPSASAKTTTTTSTTIAPTRMRPMRIPSPKTPSTPPRIFSMRATTAKPMRIFTPKTSTTPPRIFSMRATTETSTTTSTTTEAPFTAITVPPTAAPVFNNSLPVNNVTVVVADDDVFDRVFLDNDNCSSVFPLHESDEMLLNFNFASTLAGRCVLTFTGPVGALKVALQISNVTLMKDAATKVDCEKQSLGIFSHKAGNLFKMEQLCGLERNSAILLTDSQSPLITLTFVNQMPPKNNTVPFNISFNMQLFTYALQSNKTTWP